MSAQEETSSDAIVFENLRRPIIGEIAGSYAPVKTVPFQQTESFVCSNAPGCTRVVESLDDVGQLAGMSGRKLRAAFGG